MLTLITLSTFATLTIVAVVYVNGLRPARARNATTKRS